MKKLLASLMALSMVFAVTGCSESSDSSSESKAEAAKTTTTTSAPAAESMADSTTTTAAPDESAADTTTSANDTDTTSTGDEAKGTYKDNVYTSDLYTFKIDSKKWAMQESAGVDVMFTYADAGDDAELESASINVISMSNDLLNGLTASDYADQIKQTYNSMDGYTVTNDKEDKFAGKDAYIVDVTGEIGSQKVLLNQIITSDNGNLVVITYGASENAYSKLSDEFKTVLDSFELK
uniref:PsbP-related protein n=1 Tax=Ruminococcus bicirculans (ex Wegman et al. 2014) TaxID=1160721 RepID=UPI004028F5C5